MKIIGYIFYKDYIINVEDSIDIISFDCLEDYILKNYEKSEVDSIDFIRKSNKYKGIGVFNITVKNDITNNIKNFGVSIWYDLEEKCYYLDMNNLNVHNILENNILENFVFKDIENKAIPDIDNLIVNFCNDTGIKWFEKNDDYKRIFK